VFPIYLDFLKIPDLTAVPSLLLLEYFQRSIFYNTAPLPEQLPFDKPGPSGKILLSVPGDDSGGRYLDVVDGNFRLSESCS
jgi:hypothetical protein